MNLEYAAYLLNENTVLNEDAGSEGQKGARKWFDTHKMNMELGGMGNMTALDFQRKAEDEFSHPLNDALGIRDKNINKYLPGAVRIGVNECGWLSEHEDTNMLSTLKLMYAYAYFEWKDGIAAGLPGPQRGQPYAGKYNRDFNGLSFNRLYAEIGADKIAETKTRIENAHGAEEDPAAVAARHAAEEAKRARRAEEERERNSRAGEYHIEYIPDYSTSHSWFEYTNPLSRDGGCHWCITQSVDHWDSYTGNGRRSVYFCWKAESKAALKAMNNDQRWFRDWPRDNYPNAPHNEYGLSLICIMVEPDRNGESKFSLATSRYNHYNPGGHWDSDRYYGDNLVSQNDDGFRKLLRILGITEQEFKVKFPYKSGGNSTVDHTPITTALIQYRNNRTTHTNPVQLKNLLDDKCDSVYELKNNGVLKIKHGREYNFVNADGFILSPNKWFRETKGDFMNSGNCVAAVQFEQDGIMVWNIIDTNGVRLLAKNVASVDFSTHSNYARLGISTQNGMVFNLLNIKNNNIMLKHPVNNVMLFDSYYDSIPVMDVDSDRWTLIDLRGKKTNTTLPIKNIVTPNNNSYGENGINLISVQLQNDKLAVIRKRDGKILYKLLPNERVDWVGKNGFVTWDSRGSGTAKLFNKNGDLLVTNQHNAISLGEDSNYAYYAKSDGRRNKLVIYDIVENRPLNITNETDPGFVSIYKNIINIGNTLYVGEERIDTDLNGSGIDRAIFKGPFKKIIKLNTSNAKCLFNTETKEFLPYNVSSVVTTNDNYMAIYYRKKVTIFDADLNVINEFKSCPFTSQMNFDTVLVSFDTDETNKYNIINPYGELMFQCNFGYMLTPGFNTDGIAVIKAGNKEYYINVDGDVSRTLDIIAESANIYTDEPVLVEYTAPVSKKKYTWHNVAANYLD